MKVYKKSSESIFNGQNERLYNIEADTQLHPIKFGYIQHTQFSEFTIVPV